MTNRPKVSVILPVYNTEKYISQSIESILKQTFTDFELIIIDDASTDNTTNILNSFKDSRINIINKKVNSGYVVSLNMGVELAKGEYIARMDADDISLPERFAEQVKFLESNPDIIAVATKIKLIDAHEKLIGDWKNDSLTSTVLEIKSYLPKGNCICHPSIMIRKAIFDFYSYDNNQYGSEDWDLWLTLVSDGYKIAKINKVHFLYRVTNTSVSATIDHSLGVKKKAIRIQSRYLKKKVKKARLNLFDFKVFYQMLVNVLIVLKS